MHNPKTILEELKEIIYSSKQGVLTNNDYVEYTAKELKRLLEENNDGLIFKQLDKKHFLSILTNPKRENYNLMLQSINIILKYNNQYIDNIFLEISNILNSYSRMVDNKGLIKSDQDYAAAKKKLIKLLEFLYIELINKGFSKQYLYKRIQSIFVYCIAETNFDIQYYKFKQLIKNENENYTVIFQLKINPLNTKNLKK